MSSPQTIWITGASSGIGKALAVRGYIGAPMIGRTQTWIRVE